MKEIKQNQGNGGKSNKILSENEGKSSKIKENEGKPSKISVETKGNQVKLR